MCTAPRSLLPLRLRGVRSQYGVVGDHELRTVLHVQDDPVASLYAEVLMKVPSEALHLVVEPRVGDPGPVVDDCRLLRVAVRRDLQVVRDTRFGQRQGARQSRRSELEVALAHLPLSPFIV